MRLILITTTSDDRAELELISAQLVEQRLAACCQIGGPVTSVYSWNGKTESSNEWVCTIKTQKPLFQKVKSVIAQLHHYDQPQIVAVEICNVSAAYREWVCSVTD